MNKDKIIKDLKEQNDSLKLQYEYRNIRCVHLEKENERLQQENQQLKHNGNKVIRILETLKDSARWERHLYEVDYMLDILKGGNNEK